MAKAIAALEWNFGGPLGQGKLIRECDFLSQLQLIFISWAQCLGSSTWREGTYVNL